MTWNSNNTPKIEIQKEIILKTLEEKTKWQREDLLSFIWEYFKNERPKGIEEFLLEPYHYIIADTLEKVYRWEITRLIINIPPGFWKTELITKHFPVHSTWRNPYLQVIVTWFSATLTKWFSAEAKEIYESPTFKKAFPRSPKLSESQNTKEHWINKDGWSYYATGIGWAITGKRANIFIIDDPIKPKEAATSDTKRIWVNNWFDNTVISRLRDPSKDAIVIIMQRTHDDDLCWHLISKMEDGSWEEYTVLSLPAEMEEYMAFDTKYWFFEYNEWDVLSPQRFPIESLHMLEKSYWPVNYNCQYQQNPIAKWSQEFHEEWFRYYDEIPNEKWRVFTTVDPAFSKKKTADDSVITTVKFIDDKCYILEQTGWKFDPAELEDNIIYHIKKWWPETVWIEAIAAQTTITFSLRRRFLSEWIYKTEIEEIRQKDDKWAKIRSLVPLYRNGLIHHRRGEWHKLESQLLKFPRWKHDDYPDSLQMSLYLYELRPWMKNKYKIPEIKFNKYWLPVITWKTLQKRVFS